MSESLDDVHISTIKGNKDYGLTDSNILDDGYMYLGTLSSLLHLYDAKPFQNDYYCGHSIFEYMRSARYMNRYNSPYHWALKCGFLKRKYDNYDKDDYSTVVPLATPKLIALFFDKYCGYDFDYHLIGRQQTHQWTLYDNFYISRNIDELRDKNMDSDSDFDSDDSDF